ncbi:MAG: sigma-54 dependent transcriptional regulator [Proteobacteria bacterium]|nr:sigma-54 dependent transcriptional regulator [Pseudomonadota bacterium]
MNRWFRIMVVDDELAMRESLAAWLVKDGFEVATADGGEQALALMKQTPFDLVFVDIKMPGMDGLELLRRLRADHPETYAIIITAYGSIDTAVEAMKLGATDYLVKPFDPEQLMVLIDKTLQHKALVDENEALKVRILERDKTVFEDLIGQSQAMRQVFALIEDIAPTDAPVLVTGETGTGKELVARAIHARSERRFWPFVPLNCGAVTETLLESELFGHERGAFTGAVKARRGRLEMADKGVLFLDEVGDIPGKMQVDLLRVLEEKTFYRIGGTTKVQSDFRLICATHRHLPTLIEEGRFRSDFYYRINVITIDVPPLRRRPEDIGLLSVHFLERFALDTGKRLSGFTAEALAQLKGYPWPGNVRELKNVIERAVVICRGDRVGVQELSFLRPGDAPEASPRTLEEVEIDHLRRTLEASAWNVTQAARRLGIDRGTLFRKMKRHGLARPE